MLGVILIAKFHVKITSKQIQTLKAKIIWSVEIQYLDFLVLNPIQLVGSIS